MRKISERISQILKSKDLNLIDLSNYLNIDVSIIYTWRRKEYLPSTENLVLLSKFLNLSMDYILYRTENEEWASECFKSSFDKRLIEVMKERKVTQYQMIKKDKVCSSSYFNRYLIKKKLPSIETLLRFADYFNVSVDYLLGRD